MTSVRRVVPFGSGLVVTAGATVTNTIMLIPPRPEQLIRLNGYRISFAMVGTTVASADSEDAVAATLQVSSEDWLESVNDFIGRSPHQSVIDVLLGQHSTALNSAIGFAFQRSAYDSGWTPCGLTLPMLAGHITGTSDDNAFQVRALYTLDWEWVAADLPERAAAYQAYGLDFRDYSEAASSA